MATVRVHEFDTMNSATGGPVGPPSKITDVATSGSITLRTTTRVYNLTTDANCRMGFGDAAAAAYGSPILAAIDNFHEKGAGSALVLHFIAE